MPYPLPDNPHYCPGSELAVPTLAEHPEALWHRCPACGRLIAAKANGCFFAHLDHPTRLGDRVQENLDAHGLNRRDILEGPPVYAEPEPDR